MSSFVFWYSTVIVRGDSFLMPSWLMGNDSPTALKYPRLPIALKSWSLEPNLWQKYN